MKKIRLKEKRGFVFWFNEQEHSLHSWKDNQLKKSDMFKVTEDPVRTWVPCPPGQCSFHCSLRIYSQISFSQQRMKAEKAWLVHSNYNSA